MSNNDRPVKPHAAWVDDSVTRGKFFAKWNKTYNERVGKANAPAGKAEEYRKAWLLAHTKVDTLLAWNGGEPDDLIAAMTKSLDIDYPLPANNAQKPAHAPETAAPAPDVPAATNEPQAPVAPRSEPATIPATEKTTKPAPKTASAPNPFKKAEKRNSRLRLLLGGISGGGKTYTALQISRTMFPVGNVALIDTESGSAEKYADVFEFDVMNLSDYTPESYIAAIHQAEAAGYDLLIIDSLSHEWQTVLDIVDDLRAKSGKDDSRSAWKIMSPRHRALIDAILTSRLHIIATCRANAKEMPVRDEAKKITTQKVVLDLVQRNGIEYEFDIVLRMGQGNTIISDKSRCQALSDFRGIKAGVEVGKTIITWLNLETVDKAA